MFGGSAGRVTADALQLRSDTKIVEPAADR
jgi:hypothetical protein